MPSPASLSLHAAAPADARDVARLVALDEAEPLHGPVYIARVDGRPVAAYSSHDGRVAADPFVRSADAVAILRRYAGSASRRRFGLGPLGLAA